MEGNPQAVRVKKTRPLCWLSELLMWASVDKQVINRMQNISIVGFHKAAPGQMRPH